MHDAQLSIFLSVHRRLQLGQRVRVRVRVVLGLGLGSRLQLGQRVASHLIVHGGRDECMRGSGTAAEQHEA